LEQSRDSVLRHGEVVGCELLNLVVLPLNTQRDFMTTPLRNLQIGCVLAITVGACCVLAKPAYFFSFGVGSITLGVLGLVTPWVNALVYGRERRSSEG
jgi:hypothetical protein